MKVAKIVGFVLGGLLLLVALVGAIALIPGVQTWAVRKAVADQPGMKIEIGRVAAGFSAADIRDLRVVKDGIVITAKTVTARYSAWDYLAGKKINAESVAVDDLVVDLRAATPATGTGAGGNSPATKAGGNATTPATKSAAAAKPAPGAPGSFNGVLNQIQLPFDVRVARLAVKGRALLPQDRAATFEVQGSGIQTGARGRIDLKADFTDASKGAAVAAGHFTGTVTLALSADRRLTLLEVDATTSAEGPKLPTDRVKLELKAEQLAAGADESYSVNVSLLRGQRAEPLLKAAAQYRTAAREFTGAWDIAIRSEQLAAVLAGFGLPELAATGGGKFSFKPDTGAVAASGDLQGSAQKLEKLVPELARIGGIQFRAAFDGGLADNVARLERVQLDVTANDGRRIAQITTTQRVGFSLADQKVSLADPRAELARVTIQSLPLAWAQPFVQDLAIESGELSLALAVEAEPDGSRVRARALQPLALRNVTVRQGTQKIVEQLTLTANPRIDYSSTRVLAEIADLNISLPTGDAVTGSLTADVTELKATPAIAFTTQLRAKILGAHKAYVTGPLPETGPLTIESTSQGRLQGEALQIVKAKQTITREGGALLASIEVQQPVTVNLKTASFKVPNPNSSLALVRLGEVPLAWAEPFVEKSKLSGVVAGAALEVSARSAEDLTVTTTEPFTLRGVTAALDGKPMAQSLDLSATLTATKRGETITYELKRIDVKQGATALLGLNAAGEVKLGKNFAATAKGQLEADAAALMNQPAAAAFATLSRGKVTTTFDANIGDTIDAKAKIAARGLVAKQKNQVLGDLDLSLDARVKADGSGTVSAPLTLTNGARKSDVAIEGAFSRPVENKPFLFAGKITSAQLFVDDFTPLSSAAPASEKPAVEQRGNTTVVRAPGSATRPGTTTPPARDTKPFWDAVRGKVELDLKRVVYGADYIITARGTSVITDTKLSLDGLQGRFKENPYKLAGGVTFVASQAKPYTLVATADVQGLDIGEILRAAAPNEQPAFETKATLTAALNGTGLNSTDLFKNAYGKFELTGVQGVTRILARKGGASTAVNVASLGLAILGASKQSDGLTAASDLIRLLNEIHFDSVKVQVERAEDLTFKLSSMEILSPIIRLSGSGTIDSKSAEDVANAPMNIVLQLAGKGEMAYALQKAGMLGNTQDEKGYAVMSRTFKVGGTPSKPDNKGLWAILLETGASFLGPR